MKTRKELKTDYKERKAQMGVFQIQSLSSGKYLIDHSIDVQAKWNRHRAQLNFGTHENKELQKDWKKVGENGFRVSVLSEIEYQKEGTPDYKKELKVLQEMVIEELEIDSSLFYK